MTGRRDFVKLGAAAVIQAGPCCVVVEQARTLLRSGALGRIAFCRIGDPTLLAAAERLTSGSIIEVDPTFQGAAFLGSRATLVVTSAGCRIFPENV